MSEAIIGLIGGTGLGAAMLSEIHGDLLNVDTPYGRPSSPVLRTRWEGVEVAFLWRHGREHDIGPTAVPYRANVYALKSLGVQSIIASGAVGSLREEIAPRELVIVDQLIDRTTQRTRSFFDQPGAAVHVEFAEPFCPGMRQVLLAAGEAVQTTVHDGGTYVCMEGPAFSTIAESRMHRSMGGDLIGMTCLPEAKLAREAEMCYALVALVTDYDCWRPHDLTKDRKAVLEEIIEHLTVASSHSVTMLRSALRLMAGKPVEKCACHSALELAVWTRRQAIAAEARSRYGILLDRVLSAEGQG